MKAKFIYVQDEEAKNKLLKLGYHLLKTTNTNMYIFENNLDKFDFNGVNNKIDFKFSMGNKLMF